jgi:N-acetylgalactosamine kinase
MPSDYKQREIVSVILAAGKGTRMQSPNKHKATYPLEGKPVIVRAIEGYHRCGIKSHYLVVGSMAEQVTEAASQAPGNHVFCQQTEQKGTGHATKAAASRLSSLDYDDDVLVVAGDKVVEDQLLQRLITTFHETDCDAAFAVGNIADFPTSGRVISDDDGNIQGIVEVFDIARKQLLTTLLSISQERLVPAQEAKALALEYLKRESKAAKALGALWDIIIAARPLTTEIIEQCFSPDDFELRIHGRSLPPEAASKATQANLSIYLFKAPALYHSLDKLGSDNAQQEEYLTDAIGILAADGFNLQTVPLKHPHEAMAFNTKEELEQIQTYLASRSKITISENSKSIRSVTQWLEILNNSESSLRCLSPLYGDTYPNLESKRSRLIDVLQGYLSQYGDEEVLIARSPGRINIMGRHVDHQGGHNNQMAIDRDIMIVAGARDDRYVNMHSMQSQRFSHREFGIDELVSEYTENGDWLEFVNSPSIKARVASAYGDWAQYVKAAIVRFETQCSKNSLSGMNMMVSGDIPIAAGLSSSSALLVATAEAIVGLNNLHIDEQEFVEHCAEGEWYVGTRGGAGDQAAMKFARQGQIVQIGFFPLEVVARTPFFTDHVMVVCYSHQRARKTAGAKDIFNHRVACYYIGRELLKERFPRQCNNIEHLRDFNNEDIGIEYSELLEMLTTLPINMSRDEVIASLPDGRAMQYLDDFSDTIDHFPIRSVVIYGLAECIRSRDCQQLLYDGAVSTFGEWMRISHDGDRVVHTGQGENNKPYSPDYCDAAMHRWIEQARTGNPKLQLALQPGAYGCSTPQIDLMVDIALGIEGVVGAQLCGGGLGGCITALTHKQAIDDLQRALAQHYYDPHELEAETFSCYPVSGSGILHL